MTPLPQLLIIDDVYGRTGRGRNRDRELFCARLGLRDITGDVEVAPVDDPLAEAVLYCGQKEQDGMVLNDLEGVVQRIRSAWKTWPRWALVLLDMHFETGPVDPQTGEPQGEARDRDPRHYFGLKILEAILDQPEFADLPMVILSSMEREQMERRFARQGVFAFVEKDQLDRTRLDNLLRNHGYLQDSRIIGRSLPFLHALREARRMSRLGNSNLLLLGETGTGKELLADYVHRTSGRTGLFRKLFVRANDDMFSADLFGYLKGAFTGAVRDRAGEAELAHGGTLFFDEFGDIPTGAQDKLMRLLDISIREAQRMGDTNVKRLDLQVVMATNRFDILEGGFRRDLLQRANASNPIVLPPLRHRQEDIALLAEVFVRKHEAALGAERREISAEALALLQSFPWPGNVRELEQEIVQAVSSYRSIRYLSPEHLPLARRGARVQVSRPFPAVDPPAGPAGPPAMPEPEPCHSLGSLIHRFPTLEFDIGDRDQWLGRLGDLQSAYARLVARYLNAALEASALAS
ncbi:MAG: sigma-54-dependent transcriptional regulator, partial [Acidobacteriota bacterium]